MNAINVMPFDEIKGGELSIYDYVEEGYTVPEKVIQYLQTREPYMMSPGIYPHPFKDGEQLLGPYWYGDGKYYWDRDAWKYVLKYHVKLPQDFIDHVMSDEGTAFLEKARGNMDSWYQQVEKIEGENRHINLLPRDGGDISLEDF